MSAIEALAGTHRFAHYAALPVCVPESTEELAAIQSTRKRVAVERARRSRFWRPRLSHIDIDKLDDPEHWAKIPILGKDELRAMTPAAFYEDFCTHHGIAICEYWRSGGSTGRPLFYPKTYEDMLYNMIGFTRTFACAGLGTAPGSNGPGTNGPERAGNERAGNERAGFERAGFERPGSPVDAAGHPPGRPCLGARRRDHGHGGDLGRIGRIAALGPAA